MSCLAENPEHSIGGQASAAGTGSIDRSRSLGGHLALPRVAFTAAVAFFAAAIHVIPGASGLLQFDRAAIATGQGWRLLTGHLTHWNLDHLFWDLLMFIVLGCVVEIQSRRRLVGLCLGSALAISGFTWFGSSGLETYRGLSGIDTALFVSVAISIASAAVARRQWVRALVSATLLVGLTGKLLFESITGSTMFVDSATSGFVVLVEAHLLGAVVAATVFFCEQRKPCLGRVPIVNTAA